MPDEAPDFGTTVRQARERLRLTQAELAEKVGVTQVTISNWEKGKSAPEGEQRARVEAALGLGEASALGKRIQEARVRAALTQRELAKRTGFAQPTISQWETGWSQPGEEAVEKLEQVLGPLREQAGRQAQGAEPDRAQSVIGTWVNKQRQEKGWSVPELAAKAGLSPLAIYRVESGQTENPRKETLAKIQRALGATLEQDAQEVAREDATIEGLGELVDFDPNDEEDRPDVPGVYVLYDISNRPIYVGMSDNIRTRLRDHSEKFWFKRPIVETGSFIEVRDARLRRQIETLLIKFLKSSAVLNKQNVER
jgi:transcriptional regulator with XRE-family HTH domain